MIEKYQKADFEELLALNNLCYCSDERPTRAEFAEMVKSSEIWVNRVRQYGFIPTTRIIGYVMVNEYVARFPYLWSIAVHPNWQKIGEGTELMERVCTEYNSRGLELHCRQDNPAQKLYFDHGFRVVEVVPGWYVIDGKKMAGLKMRRESHAA